MGMRGEGARVLWIPNKEVILAGKRPQACPQRVAREGVTPPNSKLKPYEFSRSEETAPVNDSVVRANQDSSSGEWEPFVMLSVVIEEGFRPTYTRSPTREVDRFTSRSRRARGTK